MNHSYLRRALLVASFVVIINPQSVEAQVMFVRGDVNGDALDQRRRRTSDH